VNTSGSIPWIRTLHVFDTVNEIGPSVDLSLAKVLGDTQKVGGNSSVVLDSLLYDGGFWESFLVSLIVKRVTSTIQDLFL
jgi:hypothetical protein